MNENLIYVGAGFKRAGSHKNVHLIIEDQEFATSFAHVVNEVTCDFTLESITNGIVVRGTINGNYEAKCGYGLENFTESFSYNINELFEQGHKLSARNSKVGSQTENIGGSRFANADEEDEEQDLYSFIGADIDITQMVTDTILTNLPIAPVCAHGPENCTVCAKEVLPYISNEDLRTMPNVEVTRKIDPRWAALDELFDSVDQEDKTI